MRRAISDPSNRIATILNSADRHRRLASEKVTMEVDGFPMIPARSWDRTLSGNLSTPMEPHSER